MTIKVTKEDIEKSVRGNPNTCPIALALKRAYDFDCAVYPSWTTLGGAFFTLKNQIAQIFLPAFINRKALIYDAGGELEPFEFELNLELKENQ